MKVFGIGVGKGKGFLGVYAVNFYKEGEIVMDLSIGDESPGRDLRTIELATRHIDHPFGRYVNHHCDPNCYIDKKRELMIALRDINIGDEITFDYSQNETAIAAPFECSCGAQNCKGSIRH
ncbi:SET domain-containing protein-lysine N-methyltransferase [Chlorobium ferrooxidans]|uniref:Nuclear protein SET n=1 Tax=Chlorobium ferrooxidans DSM 13031 TaxID=377431 RepID=Q0YR82_9CHLB|nr:SET domain-containing protein-lysine N-methyltransferase [Chlorobium ferrooxidans]EAT58827.1 hypothetical protein CferDRAFT_0801 [Chlorobium ferrooxidans DSM 13031]